MLSKIGIVTTTLILIFSILIIYNSLSSLKSNEVSIKKIIYSLNFYQLIFSLLTFLILLIGFVTSDFSLINVFENSHTEKPLFYKISGVWGNHEGSLLLWINILIIFSFLFFHFNMKKNKKFCLLTLIFQNFLILGFVFFLLINSNPFSSIYPIPSEGLGLNPILQDPALAIHPPLLYVGFVGSSIYFSAAMASAISKYNGNFFATSIRPWILITWIFQTLGIVVGSIWAYYELGWGGFWFWDPVENASLMPWFVITALMHSVIILEKKNSTYSWVIILCLLTFTLSVAGTFLVRSGILNSVHTFANDPSRGLYILIFLTMMIFASLVIFFKYCKKEIYNFQVYSRETFILGNNWFMIFFLVTVLIGTVYPIFLEVLTEKKISVGPPFYNIVIIPFIIPFLFLMAFGPKINLIKKKQKQIINNFSIIFIAVFFNIFITTSFGEYSLVSSLIVISSIFLIIHSLGDLIASIKKKIKIDYSRIISHFGFGLLIFFIGINHNYSIEKDFNLKVGENKKINNYFLNFNSLKTENGKNYKAIIGNFTLKNSDNDFSETLNPEIRIYKNPEILTYESAIKVKITSDTYLTMSNILRSEYYNIKFQKKPLMIWIWISAFIISIGGIVRLFKTSVLK